MANPQHGFIASVFNASILVLGRKKNRRGWGKVKKYSGSELTKMITHM